MASSQDEGKRQAMLEKKRVEMMVSCAGVLSTARETDLLERDLLRRLQNDFQKQKDALTAETAKAGATAAERFTRRTEGLDEALKKSTIGLVSLSDFQKTRNELEEAQKREAAQKAADALTQDDKVVKAKKAKKKEKSKLSFGDEEEEEDGAEEVKKGKKRVQEDDPSSPAKKAKLLKNPAVDTSFLPDREREARERLEREELRKEWLSKQEKMKQEKIEVVYSYWDGSGHRKSVECKKGDDIASFLLKCRSQFPELRGISVENLMYIKEDLIIPHHYTFYDFIVNKARGKSGPLFSFDVHDDIRMVSDASIEKDESHAGKVVERSWYQRSKHIFPASRWEVYDPDADYGKYKIA